MTILYVIDLLGTFVFAISGVMTAVNNRFDVVGATIVGAVTAIGGGTVRDVLIGRVPVGWMTDLNYIVVIFASIPICYFFMPVIRKLRKGRFIFDTIGIGLFTILGMEKTLDVGLSPIVALLMGIVSATFGGVIRDVLCNTVPLIFRKEVYATACLIGGIIYYLLDQVVHGKPWHMVVSILVVILIRYFAVTREWEIPFNPR